MKTILFQGDSITDAGRSRTDNAELGIGYPTLVAGELGLTYPNKYVMFNRGVSGNRVVDVYARIKQDIINIKPDIISILIGVNDVWHEIDWQNGIDADKYFNIYSLLIEEIKQALPDVKIMILEPFVLQGNATANNENYPNKWSIFEEEVKKRAVKAKKIADQYNLPFVPLQDKFDEAAQLAPNSYWLKDGVHPTTAGHELIKREWIKMFRLIVKEQ